MVRALSLLLIALPLAACAFDPPTIERIPREARAPDSSAKARLARRGAPPKAGEAAPDEEIQVPGDEVAALEVDLTNFKERLIGLDSDEINDLMGAPGLERAEPPALIWQYRSTACTVDIFMFDDGGGSTVDHVEVRGPSDTVDEKACFTGLLRDTASLGGKPGAAPAPAAAAPAAKPPARSAAPAAAPAAATPAAPKAPAPEFEDDDTGPPPSPPAGAAVKAPQASGPKPKPKPEFEIEDDPDKMGPVRSEDDPAGRNEDIVE